MTPREIEIDQARHAGIMARAAAPRIPRLLVDAVAPPPADLTLNLVHEPQHWSYREEIADSEDRARRRKAPGNRFFLEARRAAQQRDAER